MRRKKSRGATKRADGPKAPHRAIQPGVRASARARWLAPRVCRAMTSPGISTIAGAEGLRDIAAQGVSLIDSGRVAVPSSAYPRTHFRGSPARFGFTIRLPRRGAGSPSFTGRPPGRAAPHILPEWSTGDERPSHPACKLHGCPRRHGAGVTGSSPSRKTRDGTGDLPAPSPRWALRRDRTAITRGAKVKSGFNRPFHAPPPRRRWCGAPSSATPPAAPSPCTATASPTERATGSSSSTCSGPIRDGRWVKKSPPARTRWRAFNEPSPGSLGLATLSRTAGEGWCGTASASSGQRRCRRRVAAGSECD